MNKRYHIQARGTAIFMALLIIAIVASLASVLMRMQQIDIHRTQMMLTSEQSYLYAQGVIDWAKGTLKSDLQNPKNTVWPVLLSPTPVADSAGMISGTLQDAQSLININNFGATSSGSSGQPTYSSVPGVVYPGMPYSQMQKLNQSSIHQMGQSGASGSSGATSSLLFNLFAVLNIQMSQQDQQQLIAAITAWVSTPKPGNNAIDPFDTKYAQLSPPYRSPHALMASVSELRLISGMTAAAFTKLLPYIIALPASTNFNAQHAPPLLQKAANQQSSAPSQQTQPGQYFLLRADVFLQDQHLVLYTLLQRNNEPQKFQVIQLWQSFGTM